MPIARAPGPGENGLFGGDRPLPAELMTVSKAGYDALLARLLAVEAERDQLQAELAQLRDSAAFDQMPFDDSVEDFLTGGV